MRRILSILAVTIALAGIAAIIYFLFFASQSGTLQVNPNGNPFGNPAQNATSTENTNGTDTGDNGSSGNNAVKVTPRLIKITNGPVALGNSIFDLAASSTPASTDGTVASPDIEARYVDRASGNIFSYSFRTSVLTRITNKTVPAAEEVAWLPGGTLAYLRFISNDENGSQHIETYGLPSNGSDGFFLARDLSQVVSASTSTILSVSSNASGSTGTVSKSDGTAPHIAFSTLLSQIVVRTAGKNWIAYTKSSANLDGYIFSVDGKTGAMTRIIGPLRGLTALPNPAGTVLLYSYTDTNGMHLALFDTATRKVTALPVATLSEKCAWTLGGTSAYCAVPSSLGSGPTLPDDWYQGAISFTDRIWRVDVSNRFAELTVDLSGEAKESIDAVGLAVDQKSEMLILTNKRDGSLWAYDL